MEDGRIRAICEDAFLLVDADGSKFVDLQQAKTALLFVFQQMRGELPQPYEYWYELVFRNFDRDRDGLIHLNDFQEIVFQYNAHYQLKRSASASSAPSVTPPLTIISDAVPAAMQHYATSVGRQSRASIAAPLVATDGGSPSSNEFPEYSGKLAIFDDYEFFDKAGQGSFGKVMVVRHKVTKQVRACKAVTIRGQQQAELIRTEINFLKLFDHPNILKLFETYFDGTNMYLISELCEGGSLLDRLNFHYPSAAPTKLMSEGQVALIVQQILAALAVCHSLHVIHRDVKPENILFVNRSKESPLKLIDFGLATTLADAVSAAKEIKVKRKGFGANFACVGGCQVARRRVMPRAGTLNFFSPEMIRGWYNEVHDVFSVGIVLTCS